MIFQELYIDIDEIVLEGFHGIEQNLLKRSLEIEFKRELLERGVPIRLSKEGSDNLIMGIPINIEKNVLSRELCRQISDSLYGGLNR